MKRYILNILIALDQLVNAMAGGDPDETISSRLGKHYRGTWMERFVDWVFRPIHGPHHCERSIEPDEGRDEVMR